MRQLLAYAFAVTTVLTANVDSAAQIMLPIRSEKTLYSKPPRERRPVFVDTSDYEGFTLDVTYGVSAWGKASTCNCNATNFRVGAGFTTASRWGWGGGLALEQTETGFKYLNPQAELSLYPRLGKRGARPLGLAISYGRLLYVENTDDVWFETQAHTGSSRFYEVRLRGYLGLARRISAIVAVGAGTVTERYVTEGGWRIVSDVETRVKHSGLRFRLGLQF